MNYKYISALVLFCTFSMSSLFAQKDDLGNAKLFISYQKTNNLDSQKENIYLTNEEAHQFDIAEFISKNRGEDFSINGRATINQEKVTWKYNSADLDASKTCNQFSPVVTSIEKIPYLGVSVRGMNDFSGVEITEIMEASPAEIYGLQTGDIITLINNTEITNTCELTTIVSQSDIGDVLDIDIQRANENMTLPTSLSYRLHKRVSWKQNCAPIIAIENTATKTHNVDLSVYPNPTGGIVQVKYAAAQKDAVQINVTDFMGRVVLTKSLEQFSGLYEETIDMKGMQDGVYFLNIVQGKEVRTEKLVLQKG